MLKSAVLSSEGPYPSLKHLVFQSRNSFAIFVLTDPEMLLEPFFYEFENFMAEKHGVGPLLILMVLKGHSHNKDCLHCVSYVCYIDKAVLHDYLHFATYLLHSPCS